MCLITIEVFMVFLVYANASKVNYVNMEGLLLLLFLLLFAFPIVFFFKSYPSSHRHALKPVFESRLKDNLVKRKQ